MRRILFQETDFNSLPLPPNGFKYIGFDGPTFSQRGEDGQIIETGTGGATGPQGQVGATGPQGPAGGGNGTSLYELTYSELTTIISSSSLTPGSYYKITDFRTCYDQPDFDVNGNGLTSSNTYKMAEVDPIIVFATSENTIDQVAYQPSYPKDQIKYDWSWNRTEITGGTAYGRIIERIDEDKNRTDYDHRTVKFKRYKSRFLDGTGQGKIISMDNGLIIGTGTNFTGDFSTSSVVFVESYEPKFYKIIDIISATQMTVEGLNYYNFDNSIGVNYQITYTEQLTTPGCLYYFNDSGQNSIYDGGNDMYDDGNYLNTDLYSNIPYTHTQMNNIEGQASIENFTFDGTVQSGDTYFGLSSSYFTNTYPGLFVMSAYNINIGTFSITGGLGADGNGKVEINDFTFEGYKIYTKQVWDAADPSIIHILIVNTIDESITHTYDNQSDDDDDILSNLENVSQIHYLLFGLSGGVKATNQQIQNVYESFLNIIDSQDINNTLNSLNNNYTTITNNLPENSTTFSSLEVKQTNISEDNLVYREILTFDLNINARNTYIGNSCDNWQINGRYFMLPNNVFTNAFGNRVDVYDNYFGDNFTNNTFGDDVYENKIGPDSGYNTCQDRFDRNVIASNFNNNTFYSVEFESNSIGDAFYNNIFISSNNDEFHSNIIGNEFYDNRFFSNSILYENRIGNYFNNNKVYDNIYKNDIGNNFYNNQIYRQVYDNTIRNHFNNNYIYNNFYDNDIGNQFENNTIGTSITLGEYEFLKNKIGVDVKGNLFSGYVVYNILGSGFTGNEISFDFNRNIFGIECVENTIGEDFEDNNVGNYFSFNNIGNYFVNNKIGNYFSSNQISYNFAFNEIGHNFSNNNIEHDFGYGGGQAYGNKIGNYFTGNTIGEYFYNNKISDVFSNNTIGRYFQSNDIQVQNLNSTNFNTNYGNIIIISDTSGASPSTPGTNGVYSGLTASGGSGVNATFDVYVSDSIVTQVLISSSGNLYETSDTLVIEGSKFGGTNGQDIIITPTLVSSPPVVYTVTNSTIIKNQNGDIKLYYLSDFGIAYVNAIESYD